MSNDREILETAVNDLMSFNRGQIRQFLVDTAQRVATSKYQFTPNQAQSLMAIVARDNVKRSPPTTAHAHDPILETAVTDVMDFNRDQIKSFLLRTSRHLELLSEKVTAGLVDAAAAAEQSEVTLNHVRHLETRLAAYQEQKESYIVDGIVLRRKIDTLERSLDATRGTVEIYEEVIRQNADKLKAQNEEISQLKGELNQC